MSRTSPRLKLTIGGFCLRAGLWPTLATLVMMPILISLGVWQLNRAEEKRLLQIEYDRHQDESPVSLELYQQAEPLRFRRVVAHGYYEPAYQILLDNRVEQGQVGYHVLTPLRIEGSNARVLVNRGWVPLGQDRQHLPNIATPQGKVEVRGVVVVPDTHGFHLGGARPRGGSWQPVWQYLDVVEYSKGVPFPVQALVVLLDPDSAAGGYARYWARLDTGIATHQGYAFQWFSLAIALAAIYILVNTRRTNENEPRPNDP
jgi:surfeit locus 1 family protein